LQDAAVRLRCLRGRRYWRLGRRAWRTFARHDNVAVPRRRPLDDSADGDTAFFPLAPVDLSGMTIRSQLMLLAMGAALPVLAFAILIAAG